MYLYIQLCYVSFHCIPDQYIFLISGYITLCVHIASHITRHDLVSCYVISSWFNNVHHAALLFTVLYIFQYNTFHYVGFVLYYVILFCVMLYYTMCYYDLTCCTVL